MLFFMPCVAWDHRSFTASLAPSKVFLPVCSVEAMLPAPAAGDAPVLCAAAEVGLVEEGDALSAASDPGCLWAGPAQRYNRLEGNEVPGQRDECKNGCPTQPVTGATHCPLERTKNDIKGKTSLCPCWSLSPFALQSILILILTKPPRPCRHTHLLPCRPAPLPV